MMDNKENKNIEMKEITNQENQITQSGLMTYFPNNLVVIKDPIMFKLLFKLVSIHQLNYNKLLLKLKKKITERKMRLWINFKGNNLLS